MMLLCQLIPQEEMYKYKWFAPTNHQNWYYSLPRKNIETVFDIHPDLIYKTLDDNLKNIFELVASKNYKTLPSCEGHFHDDKEIKEKYHSILSDLIKIKNNDFAVKDIETSKKYKYNNPQYVLPWNSFQDFNNDICNHMSRGYFGIVDPVGVDELNLGSIKFKKENVNDHVLLHILIDNKSERDMKDNWSTVYHILENKLK
jgi:hypothetical protein